MVEIVDGKLILKNDEKKDVSQLVYGVICNISNYSTFMPSVKKVAALIRNDGFDLRSKWEIDIDGCPLWWISRDVFDEKNMTYSFKTVEGDFDKLEGRWIVKKCKDNEVEVLFSISYDLGIPTIQEVVGPVLREKMKQNLINMLTNIAQYVKQENAIITVK
jgi:ribosome-associated toxin RatA of RatAB toxin-antitoxin module